MYGIKTRWGKGILRSVGLGGAHILCDVFPVPIGKLQGIVLRVSQGPSVGQEAASDVQGRLSHLPLPHLAQACGACGTYASHTSFSTVARGFACKWSCHSRCEGKELG